MNKFWSTLSCVLFLVIGAHAQDDNLDDIFDDGDNTANFDILVGTDVITFAAGTPNVYGELQLKEKFGFNLGVGLVPFGFLADFSNPMNAISGESTTLIRDIKGGFFYDIGLKYIQSYGETFQWYYYANYKKWKYRREFYIPAADETEFVHHRRKVNLGSGYTITPFDQLGFDAHLGVFLGADTQEYNDGVGIGTEFIIGFDLGLTAFYRF